MSLTILQKHVVQRNSQIWLFSMNTVVNPTDSSSPISHMDPPPFSPSTMSHCVTISPTSVQHLKHIRTSFSITSPRNWGNESLKSCKRYFQFQLRWPRRVRNV